MRVQRRRASLLDASARWLLLTRLTACCCPRLSSCSAALAPPGLSASALRCAAHPAVLSHNPAHPRQSQPQLSAPTPPTPPPPRLPAALNSSERLSPTLTAATLCCALSDARASRLVCVAVAPLRPCALTRQQQPNATVCLPRLFATSPTIALAHATTGADPIRRSRWVSSSCRPRRLRQPNLCPQVATAPPRASKNGHAA